VDQLESRQLLIAGVDVRVTGGGQANLEDARKAAAQAIAFALEGRDRPETSRRIEYLEVAVGF